MPAASTRAIKCAVPKSGVGPVGPLLADQCQWFSDGHWAPLGGDASWGLSIEGRIDPHNAGAPTALQRYLASGSGCKPAQALTEWSRVVPEPALPVSGIVICAGSVRRLSVPRQD